tara:strand:+ start:624 stop:2027 length:1404 start_codon:yes stop_codon:yes gene_type:complete
METVNKINFIKKLGIDVDDDGRVRLDVTVMKKLKPIPMGNWYKELIVRDKNLMGFRARVSPGGQRTFLFRYRPKGKDLDGSILNKQNITLGRWYDSSSPKEKDLVGITPTVARKLAEEMKMKIARKEDPYSIIKARRKGRTLISVYQDWIDKRLVSAKYKPKSVIDYKSRFNLYVKCNSKLEKHKKLYRNEYDVFSLFRKPYKDITKDDYISIHNAVTKSSPYQANRVIEDLRLVEQYAIEIGVLKKRVCIFKNKELNKELDRLDKEAPYTPYEMKRYRIAALKLIKLDRIRSLVPCFSLLGCGLLGGRSKSMVFSLEWDQINTKNKIISFLDTKNNEPIKLSYDYRFSAILKIMNQVRQSLNHRDKRRMYVFPTSKKTFKTKHINDPRKTHTSIIGLSKIDYKCMHFLRHSWATNTYEATHDVLAVKEMGGWKSLEAVQKYVDISEKIKKERLAAQRRYLAKTHVA